MMHIAHRGGSGLYLENTLAAFDNAVVSGCDGAELDVHLSADGEPLVHHNAQLDYRYTKMPNGRWLAPDDERPFAEMTRAEIQSYRIGTPNPNTDYGTKFPDLTAIADQHIPTLAEVIERVKARSADFKLVIEIKSANLFDPAGGDWQQLVDTVLATVEQLRFTERTILCGFDWRALRYARRQVPMIPLWMTTHPFDWLPGEDAAPSDLPAGKRFLEQLHAADNADGASGGPWYDGFRPASAEDAGRAVAAAGGDRWFGYYTDCTVNAIANAHQVGVGAGAWTVNLRDADKRAALDKRDVDAVCVDYF